MCGMEQGRQPSSRMSQANVNQIDYQDNTAIATQHKLAQAEFHWPFICVDSRIVLQKLLYYL